MLMRNNIEMSLWEIKMVFVVWVRETWEVDEDKEVMEVNKRVAKVASEQDKKVVSEGKIEEE